MRQLGDLSLLLRQYEAAAAMYRLAAQDYLAMPNHKWYAGVEVGGPWLVCCAISCVMQSLFAQSCACSVLVHFPCQQLRTSADAPTRRRLCRQSVSLQKPCYGKQQICECHA